MATYKADIKTTPTGSIYSVTVEAGASYVAKQEIERLYNPIFIRNLRQVSNGSSSSSSGDTGGYLMFFAVIFGIWAVVEYWWIVTPIAAIVLIAWLYNRFSN